MGKHPPLTATLAVKPEVVRFTLEELTVRCPKCRVTHRYVLTIQRLPEDPSCPGCGQPWRWS